MSNRTVIISTIGFLLISFVYLSFVEQKKQDADSQNWWAVYFENPKDNSLNFTIENHSVDEKFTWEIAADKDKVTQGSITIKKSEKKTIPVSSDGISNKKITITVTGADNNKEIYKTL